MKYIKTNAGDIYKLTKDPTVYLKVSPYIQGEDRRISSDVLTEMINNGTAVYISKANAREEVNTLWRNTTFEWVFKDNQYKSEGNVQDVKLPVHEWTKTYKNRNDELVEYKVSWHLCMCHGQIFWFQYTCYYPQVQIVKFEGLDKEPSYFNTLKWTNIKNLRPIYKLSVDNNWEIM